MRSNNNSSNFAVALYNSDGSLDTTFSSDGKIVVGGQSNGDLVLGRFNANCTADTTFDSDGIATADLGGTVRINALLTQSDGTIVAAGSKDSDFVISRFTGAGALDTAFGASGGYTDTYINSTSTAYALARQADGKFVAAGRSSGSFGIARYTAGGILDTTFDSDGKVTTSIGGISGGECDRSLCRALSVEWV